MLSKAFETWTTCLKFPHIFFDLLEIRLKFHCLIDLGFFSILAIVEEPIIKTEVLSNVIDAPYPGFLILINFNNVQTYILLLDFSGCSRSTRRSLSTGRRRTSSCLWPP